MGASCFFGAVETVRVRRVAGFAVAAAVAVVAAVCALLRRVRLGFSALANDSEGISGNGSLGVELMTRSRKACSWQSGNLNTKRC